MLTRPDYSSANELAVLLTKETGIEHVVVINHYLYIVKLKGGTKSWSGKKLRKNMSRDILNLMRGVTERMSAVPYYLI